jgi:tRNA pseudouridine32 synthase/23S rRNA pseudouridine746 synthase
MSRPFQNTSEAIEILYTDAALVIVNKPTLLLSVPGRGSDKQDCLISRLRKTFSTILTIHRLDWETSGLTVLALTKEAQRSLSRQFQERQVNKHYTAIVYGKPEQAQGEINLPLRCDWENRPKQIVDHKQGKASHTVWQYYDDSDNAIDTYKIDGKTISRLLLLPTTGRSHQLRVHMQAMGHPILGDPLYAHPQALSLSKRLLLHASYLEFTHPTTHNTIKFYSPAPF